MMFPKRGKRRSTNRLSSRIEVLDRVFSEWVRLSNADANGYASCITCNKPRWWQLFDAGHYVGRRYFATRWDPKNVKPQCVTCNQHREGEKGIFARAIDKIHGKGTAERLDNLARMRPAAKFTITQIDEMIVKYRAKVRVEREQRGICG